MRSLSEESADNNQEPQTVKETGYIFGMAAIPFLSRGVYFDMLVDTKTLF